MLIIVKFMGVNTRTTSKMVMVMRAVKNDSLKLHSNQLLDQITKGLVRTIVGQVEQNHDRFCGLTDASLCTDRF